MATITRKKLKLMTTSALVVAILFTVALMASATAWTAEDPGYDLEFARSNEGILPEFVTGNSPDNMSGFMAVKQDYGQDGFIFSGDEPLQFDFHPDEEDLSKVFSIWLFKDDADVIYIHHWEAVNLQVHHVLVKGGPNYFAYNYDGSLMEDGNLYSPLVGANNQNIADVSHFVAFVTDIPEETTIEETTTEETTTEETTTEETTTEETTTEETTTEETTTEETTTEETTTEETTTEETTTEETTAETIVVTTESIPEGTEPTTEETTTEETTSEATTAETIVLTQETIPLATETTQGDPDASTVLLEPEEIPQTGQSATGIIAGAVLLALAASLGLLMRKVRKNEN